jgi:excisionase family DNA binding protein
VRLAASRINRGRKVSRAFTVASLAAEWECSEGVIRKAIREGQLGCFRLGSLIRIPAEEVARFECQNIRSSGSGDDTQSSGETTKASVTATALPRPTALELKLKQGGFGRRDTVRTGPWAGS